MYDIAIIGAGPAGSSAAIFAAKAGKKTLVIDSGKGMTQRAWVENHYGIKSTQLLLQGMVQQLPSSSSVS